MVSLPDFSLQQVLLRIVAILVITAVHGLALTLAARLLGDRGPEYDGRLTLNPFQHLDLIGAVAMFLFSFGWINPIKVDARQFRTGRLGALLLPLAGLLAVLAVALLLLALRPLVVTTLPDSVAFTTLAVFNTIARMSATFIAINLIPLPPLTAGYALAAIRPGLPERILRQGLLVRLALAALIALDPVRALLLPLRELLSWVGL